ncbi:hypothetical protein Taro_007665 [Colocasia esculenta]|uniref:Uncharacterized protein n=1 Tax=Colocasia esculenta TaxID=4460 RepID=A0A843U119_COLES|nr:hypothetical protein [Colocasia esculenta]
MHEVGTRCHRSSLPDGRGGGLFALFEFIAYLIGLNSNLSGSSDPWVAARPSGSLAGSGRILNDSGLSMLRGWKRPKYLPY